LITGPRSRYVISFRLRDLLRRKNHAKRLKEGIQSKTMESNSTLLNLFKSLLGNRKLKAVDASRALDAEGDNNPVLSRSLVSNIPLNAPANNVVLALVQYLDRVSLMPFQELAPRVIRKHKIILVAAGRGSVE